MHRAFWLAAILAAAFVAVAAPGLGLGAQDASPVPSMPGTPTPGGAAGQFLLDPARLGDGWSLHRQGAIPASATVFADAAAALYVGPSGAFVRLHVYVILPGRAALQRSWEDASAVYGSFSQQYRLPIYEFAPEQQRVAALPIPEGCVDVTRSGGFDPFTELPASVTQCAIDPDVIVVVATLGDVGQAADGLGSDRVSSLVAGFGD